MKDRPEVLLVHVHVRSAGSQPADQLNPAVVAAMAEWGIDLSREFPRPLTDDLVQAADAVITMGCGDARPIYPSKRYLDWNLEDPARQAHRLCCLSSLLARPRSSADSKPRSTCRSTWA